MYSKIKNYKQKHFHHHRKKVVRHIHLGTLHLGAWLLTFSALLSFAKNVHHDYAQAAQHDEAIYAGEEKPTKLPKIEKTAHYEYDFDIGLRTPSLAGE